MFKSNLNERSREGYKMEEQKIAFQNIKLLYESQEAAIKLYNDYSPLHLKLNIK